ncbi:MAG: GWxTD domain-containing protein [Candidatus Aminicenantaceae bacterium]
MRKLAILIIIIVLGLSLLFVSCALKRLEKRLDPESEEFYNKVRYIITSEEAKIFLELPPSARDEFIDKFWKRRDPTLETERNEFKEAYFARIEEANRLFKGGGRPGWLQDRGRIYILFGPPNERETNPMGGHPIDPYVDPRDMVQGKRLAAGEKPTEIWIYYDLFSSLQKPHSIRLIFVDAYGTGDYKLTTNLDELLPGTMGIETQFQPNLIFTHELYKEEAERAKLYLRRALFNFSWNLIKQKDEDLGSNLLIHILLPYKKIVFEEEAGRLRAKLEIEVHVKDAADEIIWQFRNEHPLDFREEFLEQHIGEAWEVEVPVRMWLEKGEYTVYICLKNLSGAQEIEKLLPLKM